MSTVRFSELAAKGFSVFPLAPGSKRPVFAWKRFQTALATPDELASWDEWIPFSRVVDGISGRTVNVGIATGALSGITVVDCDNAGHEAWCDAHLPPTLTVKTGRGSHRYYRHAEGARNTSTPWFDVRGEGGYVVGPGSTHENGATYTVVGSWWPVEALPLFHLCWLALARASKGEDDAE